MNGSSKSTCPSCGAPATGKFCAECGASLRGATCAFCGSPLTPGARFCHKCGMAAGGVQSQGVTGPPPPVTSAGRANLVPWSIAGLAFLAVVAILAGQRFGESRNQSSASEGAPQMPLGAGGAAPDISSMSPRERADRLYDRMMRMSSENKKDSVAFFAPMALAAYEALGPLDNDLRYDMGRVAEVSGNLDVARAQADSILGQNPDHLLGLILAQRVAQLKGDTKAVDRYASRLLQIAPSEMTKNLEEYTRHKGDIDMALQEARAKK
jgi:hypothetical protein